MASWFRMHPEALPGALVCLVAGLAVDQVCICLVIASHHTHTSSKKQSPCTLTPIAPHAPHFFSGPLLMHMYSHTRKTLPFTKQRTCLFIRLYVCEVVQHPRKGIFSATQASKACASAYRCVATRAPVLHDPTLLAALLQHVLPALQQRGPGLDAKAHVVRGTAVLLAGAQGKSVMGLLQALMQPLTQRAQQALPSASRCDVATSDDWVAVHAKNTKQHKHTCSSSRFFQ